MQLLESHVATLDIKYLVLKVLTSQLQIDHRIILYVVCSDMVMMDLKWMML